MAGMTMIVFEKDGREVMLADADSIHAAMTNGSVGADTMVTVYLSDGGKSFKPAAQHKQLSPYFAPAEYETGADAVTPLLSPVADAADNVAPLPNVPLTTAERLKALEADIAANPDALSQNSWRPSVQPMRPTPAPYHNNRAMNGWAGTGSGKSRVTAAILALLLGGLGVHKFYMGKSRAGWMMLGLLLVGIFAFGTLSWVAPVIALIEGVLYLTQSDAEFEARYFGTGRDWF